MDKGEVVFLVIPIYNRLEVTKKGLHYLCASIDHYRLNASSALEVRIIIVDDGSTDGSSEWIATHHPDITILRGDGGLWWTGAVNLAIKHALETCPDTAAIVLQNDDVVVEHDWFINLMNAAMNHPDSLIGCATSTLHNKDAIVYGGRKLHPWFATEKMLNVGSSKRGFPKGYVVPSFDLYGRGLYIPVRIFKEIGLFNQEQFRHRGDMDIPLRAKKVGFNLLVSYDAIVYEFPEHAFGLDSKKKISLKEAFKALTDFRSSNNVKFVYYYSRLATRNPIQFVVFFSSNLFYNMRRVCWRVVHQYI